MRKFVNVVLVVSAAFLATACCCGPAYISSDDRVETVMEVAKQMVTNTHPVAMPY